jgi:hypothetical protein
LCFREVVRRVAVHCGDEVWKKLSEYDAEAFSSGYDTRILFFVGEAGASRVAAFAADFDTAVGETAAGTVHAEKAENRLRHSGSESTASDLAWGVRNGGDFL